MPTAATASFTSPAACPGPILEAACWVHARRPFFVMADLAENARRKAQCKKPAVISPLALEAVRRIDVLFEIERAINGQSPEKRKAARQELSAPVVADLEAWMRAQRAKLSHSNDVAKAMDYMLKRWSAFTRFLDDGRICLSNNAAERGVRGIAMLRSLYPSSSSVWKHWNLVFRFHATRAILSRDRGDDALSLQVACPDLMRCVGYNLHVGKDPSFDCSADRMMGYA
jgi:hypothetical protein